MSEEMRSEFEAWAKPDSVQKQRTVCGTSYMDPGMAGAWAAWQAATNKARLESDEKIRELEAAVSKLTHNLKNAECAAEIMKHLADEYERKAKKLAKELAAIRAQGERVPA